MRRVGVCAVVLVGATLLPSVVQAQAHVRADEAMSALRRNDCPATLGALRQGMLDNEPASFYLSGNLAETGVCSQADPAVAAKAYERAALLGHRDAASSLALLYAEGSGVAQSYRDAGRWYAIAAGASATASADTAAFEKPDAVARTYVRAVHELAEFELANRLKLSYPIGVRVRFDARTGVASIVDRRAVTGAREVPDREILSSYAEAVRMLPKPALPATGEFATVRTMGTDDGA